MNNVMNNDSQQVEDAKQVYVLTFDLILSGFYDYWHWQSII